MAYQDWPASGGASSSYASALRLGPALPPNGTPTPRPSLERLNERLERLAFGERLEGSDPPPLETYTVTATEHGDIYRATDEYVRWFRRTYPAAGGEDRVSRPAPGPAPQGVGGKEAEPLPDRPEPNYAAMPVGRFNKPPGASSEAPVTKRKQTALFD